MNTWKSMTKHERSRALKEKVEAGQRHEEHLRAELAEKREQEFAMLRACHCAPVYGTSLEKGMRVFRVGDRRTQYV